MKYLLETGDWDVIRELELMPSVKLFRFDADPGRKHFVLTSDRPLKAVQSFCNEFCTITGQDRDRVSISAFRTRFTAYLASLGSKFEGKGAVQIGREARKYCGLKSKAAWHEGKTQRVYVGIRFRETDPSADPTTNSGGK